MKIPISVIITTKNEERNIEKCLKSCAPASEIFIVDSESTDKTQEIAKKFIPKNKIINFKWNGKWPKKKYWSILNLPISNDWVLMLDADEAPTIDFWKEISENIGKDKYDAYMVPLAYYFLGKRIRFGDPVRKLSLFKYKKAIYEDEDNVSDFSKFDFEGHASPIIAGKIGELKSRVIHLDFKGISDYFSRHNKYADWEANLILKNHYVNNKKGNAIKGKFFGNPMERRRFMKNWLMNSSLKPLWYFVYSYFFRLGFLDGKAGLHYNLFKSFYFLQIELKVLEMKKQLSFSDKSAGISKV